MYIQYKLETHTAVTRVNDSYQKNDSHCRECRNINNTSELLWNINFRVNRKFFLLLYWNSLSLLPMIYFDIATEKQSVIKKCE